MGGMKKVATCVIAAILAFGLLPGPAFATAGESLTALGSLFVMALPAPDYSWYSNDATEYAIENSKQFVAFANLVNGVAPEDVADGPVSFEGKTVKSSASGTFDLWGHGDWTPIGDKAHPFAGTFDGSGVTVNNFTVDGSKRAAYLGLFGYVSKPGAVRNVTVGSGAVVKASRAKATKEVLHHIGGVAGYCAGTMNGCVNSATVTVTSGVLQTAKNHQVIYAVGGVSGECVGDMVNCRNQAAGAVTVKATAAAAASVDDSGLVRYVGGVVGMSGDSMRIGSVSNSTEHGSLIECENVAPVRVDTPSKAGTDRFGETVYSRSVCVGGVAGYARGDVTDCKNGLITSSFGNKATASYGYVRAEHGTAVGGIVGSLRATPSTSNNSTGRVASDDGGEGDDPIVLSGCMNHGDVYALNAVGGIAGSAGSYTDVTGCVNARRASNTFVVATRWNKPTPAGVVGTTAGNVSYCANFATVASGVWKNEASRTLTNGSGYFASGIAGMTSFFSEIAPDGSENRTTPVPEVYACYNAGYIMAVSGMRQCGLVGDNGGHVHDNILLKGMVEKNTLVYSESRGTESDNVVLDSSTLRSKDAVKALNACCDIDEWATWWVPSDASASKNVSLNHGYPVNRAKNPVGEGDRKDLSGFSVSFDGASYTGGTGGSAAVPAATVTDGAGGELVQGVDFRVVPQPDAVAIASNAYTGQVVGIGQYRGERSSTYSIVKGRLADCTVSVESAMFDFNGHYPSKAVDGPGKVTVRTPGGVEVDPSEYDVYKVERRASGKVAETFSEDKQPVNAFSTYYVSVRVAEGSKHFDGSSGSVATPKKANFAIAPADIQTDVNYGKAKISWSKRSYAWVSSSDEASTANPKTKLSYTGSPIKPTVSGLTYNGHALKEGADYLVVYGNPNPIKTGGETYDTNNTGSENGKGVGCVTVRFKPGGNFKSYQNMFFGIPNGNLASAKIGSIAAQKYTGKAIKAVPSVKAGSKTLKNGTDFTVSYKNNVKVGTATATVKGKGAYSGLRSTTFKVKYANTLTVKGKTPALSAKKLRNANQVISAKNAMTVSKAKGAVTCKKVKGNAKITVASSGKITAKKGLKKGLYRVKVQVKAAGTSSYLAATKTITVKIRVV